MFVLIGQKKSYSKKDGFIHNNPGQWVFIGGHCKKSASDDKLINSSIREFVEETGHYINKKNIVLKRFRDFSVSYYKVYNDLEYNLFKTKKQSQGLDLVHVELDELKWTPIEKTLDMMNPGTTLNIPRNNVNNYLSDWKKNNWKLKSELRFFKNKLENTWNTKLTNIEYNNIVNEIKYNLRRSKNYRILFDFLTKYFAKRSYTDWYYEMSIHLYKNIDSIENKLNSNKYSMYDSMSKQEKSKSPPKSRFARTTGKPKSPLLRRGPRRFTNSKKPKK